MATENENIETTVETTPEDKTTSANLEKPAKVFTQEDVNSAVKGRLARESEKFTTASKEWEAERTAYEEKIAKFDEALKKLIEDKKSDLTETERLLLGKLDSLDQLDFLVNTKKETKANSKLPIIPNPADKKNDKPTQKLSWS